MSDIVLFAIGLGVTSIVGSAVGLLVWGAAQEEYRRGVHAGKDLLRSADRLVRAGGEEDPRRGLRVMAGRRERESVRKGA